MSVEKILYGIVSKVWELQKILYIQYIVLADAILDSVSYIL